MSGKKTHDKCVRDVDVTPQFTTFTKFVSITTNA